MGKPHQSAVLPRAIARGGKAAGNALWPPFQSSRRRRGACNGTRAHQTAVFRHDPAQRFPWDQRGLLAYVRVDPPRAGLLVLRFPAQTLLQRGKIPPPFLRPPCRFSERAGPSLRRLPAPCRLFRDCSAAPASPESQARPPRQRLARTGPNAAPPHCACCARRGERYAKTSDARARRGSRRAGAVGQGAGARAGPRMGASREPRNWLAVAPPAGLCAACPAPSNDLPPARHDFAEAPSAGKDAPCPWKWSEAPPGC